MGEKVGSDVLGSESALGHGGLTGQQREKVKKKMAEEKKRKAMGDLTDLEGKEVHGDIPSDQKEPRRLGEHGYDEKDVNVREHKRGRPKKNQNKAEKLPKSFWEQ